MPIRVPSVNGVVSGGVSYASGALAGMVVDFASQYVGGVFGNLLVGATAGAIVPGERGTVIATTLGLQLGQSGLAGRLGIPGFNRGDAPSGGLFTTRF